MQATPPTQQIPAQLVFKRYELKYLLDVRQRAKLDALMRPHMTADAWGQSTISNVYFDTPSNVLIRRSIEGGPYKEKLRVRAYGDVGPESPAYVEVKEKLDGVVYKRRTSSTASRALAELSSGSFPGDDQVSREIDYFVRRYRDIAPAFFIASDRCAYYATDDPDFRITLDTNIRWRDSQLTLTDGTSGHALLAEGQTLVEVKTAGAIPLWLVDFLTANGLYQVPFSKVGKAYLAREHALQAERIARLGARRPKLRLVSGVPAHMAPGYQPSTHERKANYA